jgi:hypothetical protein
MGADGAKVNQVVPVVELSTEVADWHGGGSRIRGQSKEGRGSPEDEKDRHSPCQIFFKKKSIKKGGESCPPVCVTLCHNLHPFLFVTVDNDGRSA